MWFHGPFSLHKSTWINPSFERFWYMVCYFESHQIKIVTILKKLKFVKGSILFGIYISLNFFRNLFYGLCGPFFRCGRLWGMRHPEICWQKNRRNFWNPVPPNRLHFFFYGLCFFFSAELHYTNCVPDFCWKKIGGTFGGLCPRIGCIFFTGYVFFWRNSTTQIMCLTSADKINRRNLVFRPMVRRGSTSQNV